MSKPIPVACPKCSGQVQINVSSGGRGTKDLTSYRADCDQCGQLVGHLSDTGRRDSAVRNYNRWAREYHVPVPASSIVVNAGYGGYRGGAEYAVAQVPAITAASSLGQRARYLVSGYCMVPMKAAIEVDAESPEQALELAKEQWKRGAKRLIVPGTDDEGAACDWRPTAELQTN